MFISYIDSLLFEQRDGKLSSSYVCRRNTDGSIGNINVARYNLRSSDILERLLKTKFTIGIYQGNGAYQFLPISKCLELVLIDLNSKLESFTGVKTSKEDFEIRKTPVICFSDIGRYEPVVGTVHVSYDWISTVSLLIDPSDNKYLFKLFSFIKSADVFCFNAIGLRTLETLYNMHINGLINYRKA